MCIGSAKIMSKFGIIILLCNIFKPIYASDWKIYKTQYYRVIAEEEAVQSLNKIQPNHVLPLILFFDESTKELHPAENFSRTFTHKGRIVNPTTFTRKNGGKQLFFCPNENSNEKCFVHKEFQRLEPLQCVREAIPTVQLDEGGKSCSSNDTGIRYKLIYEICSNQEYDFTTHEILLYEFCYDVNKNRMLYAGDYIANQPKLLNSALLFRERNIQYDMTIIDKLIPSNYLDLETAINNGGIKLLNTEAESQLKKQKTSDIVYTRRNTKQIPIHHVYKAQKLIPFDDKAFALLRKPFFQYLNVELQHERLIDIWNQINHYIRVEAEVMYSKEEIKCFVRTGVFELTSAARNDGQLSNMWYKLIYFINNDPMKIQNAIVILMNNFIDYETSTAPEVSSTSQEKSIEYYCEKNLCADTLIQEFKRLGSRIRCCPAMNKIAELFNQHDFVLVEAVSRIPGISEIIE